MSDLDKTINAGLCRLREIQLEDGSFSSYTSPARNFSEKIESAAVFANPFVLSSIASLRGEFFLSAEIAAGLGKFLLSQRSDQWSFNYWKRGSKESAKFPYPDDLDSTACAFGALRVYDDEIIDGEAIARFAMMLAAEEAAEGGPYYTWLAEEGDDKWKDIDLAVNANIGYALYQEGVSLDALNALAEAAIAEGKYFSPYYASAFPVAYFISRFYRGPKMADLAEWFNKNISLAENPLDAAFCVNGLYNLGAENIPGISGAIDIIAYPCLSSDRAVYPFVIEKENRTLGEKEYSGSEALQLALAVEAIARFRSKSEIVSRKSGYDLDRIFSEVILLAEKRFGKEAGELESVFWDRFNRITSKSDGKGIILIASVFVSSFAGEKRAVVPAADLARLGFMNLCGWIAYTIYDDFLDGEGDIRLLSLANVCLREVAFILKDEAAGDSFSYCRDILDGIDSANLWEVAHARAAGGFSKIHDCPPSYGDFESLASRSLGHALGPLMVLFFLGFGSDSAEVCGIRRFFSDYIIARQLNDDLRDWEEDLSLGRLSPAVALLISEARSAGKDEIDIAADLPFLRDLFWRQVVPVIAEESLAHCRSAAEALNSVGEIISFPEILLSVLFPVRSSAERTIRDQKTTLDFLRVIGGE